MDSEYQSLVGSVERRLVRAVWRVLRHPQDAEDALQDGLLRVWKRFRRVQRHPNPEILVIRICLHAAYDILRKRAASKRLKDRLRATGTPAEHLETGVLEDAELRLEIARALSCLTPQQTDAVLLRFVDERSFAEIGQALDCSESTARTHVARARSRLARLLGDAIQGMPA